MKVNLITRNEIRKIIEEELRKKLNYIHKELDILRRRVEKIEDDVKINFNRRIK